MKRGIWTNKILLTRSRLIRLLIYKEYCLSLKKKKKRIIQGIKSRTQRTGPMRMIPNTPLYLPFPPFLTELSIAFILCLYSTVVGCRDKTWISCLSSFKNPSEEFYPKCTFWFGSQDAALWTDAVMRNGMRPVAPLGRRWMLFCGGRGTGLRRTCKRM